METMILLGAEQVQAAANQIRQAAEDMNRAAQQQEAAFREFSRFLQDWLIELRDVFAIRAAEGECK
jgi:hypothetical protein